MAGIGNLHREREYRSNNDCSVPTILVDTTKITALVVRTLPAIPAEHTNIIALFALGRSLAGQPMYS